MWKTDTFKPSAAKLVKIETGCFKYAYLKVI